MFQIIYFNINILVQSFAEDFFSKIQDILNELFKQTKLSINAYLNPKVLNDRAIALLLLLFYIIITLYNWIKQCQFDF